MPQKKSTRGRTTKPKPKQTPKQSFGKKGGAMRGGTVVVVHHNVKGKKGEGFLGDIIGGLAPMLPI